GWTMPQKMTFGTWLIEGRLSSLIVNEQLQEPSDSTELLFHADHLHPLARVMSVQPQRQKRLEILGSTIEFKYERASNVVAITAQHSAQLKPTDTERWLREPLRIMLGQPVEPRLSARN